MEGVIYIYVKDRDANAFLRDFFGKRGRFPAKFFGSVKLLRAAAKKAAPDLIVAEAPECMERVMEFAGETPVLAILPHESTKGMKSVIHHGMEHYLLAPYQSYDLEYKLDITVRHSTYIKHLLQDKKDLETVAELSEVLASTLDPQEVLYLIVKKLSDVIPVSRCSILSINMPNPESAEVVSTFEDKTIRHLGLDLNKYPEIAKALKTRRSVIIRDAQTDPLMVPVRKVIKSLGIRSIVVVPVVFRSEIIGTLFLRTTRREYVFSEREVRLFKLIATTAAKALHNAYLFQQLSARHREMEQLAITDYLTGIYNIRYLYHRLEQEFSAAARYQFSLSCIMMDLDHFKRINDLYGHRTGDTVLREFADLVQQHVRKSDTFARYGGEEFILLMPHSTSEGAVTKAKRLIRAVRNHAFGGLPETETITVSCGIASAPHRKLKEPDELITFADRALLTAKRAGRDTYRIYR
jgi:diguanylate cyclase (GGDEF)-like protein